MLVLQSSQYIIALVENSKAFLLTTESVVAFQTSFSSHNLILTLHSIVWTLYMTERRLA